MGETEKVQREMQRRISRQNRTVIGWVGGFFVLFLLIGIGRRLLDDGAPATESTERVMTIFFGVGMALSFVPGFLGLFYNPRCPKCDAWIVKFLTYKLSLFGSSYPNECPNCGVQLFDPERRPRLLGK